MGRREIGQSFDKNIIVGQNIFGRGGFYPAHVLPYKMKTIYPLPYCFKILLLHHKTSYNSSIYKNNKICCPSANLLKTFS